MNKGNTTEEEAYNNMKICLTAAGHVESIKFLLENGADPNTKGQFQRTPLYRAAFAGHMEAVEVRNYHHHQLFNPAHCREIKSCHFSLVTRGSAQYQANLLLEVVF